MFIEDKSSFVNEWIILLDNLNKMANLNKNLFE